MNDKELIMEIFKRLDDNFYDLDNPMVAETDSEIAADALAETLFNIGLEDLYEREDSIDVNGCWFARFVVKPE